VQCIRPSRDPTRGHPRSCVESSRPADHGPGGPIVTGLPLIDSVMMLRRLLHVPKPRGEGGSTGEPAWLRMAGRSGWAQSASGTLPRTCRESPQDLAKVLVPSSQWLSGRACVRLHAVRDSCSHLLNSDRPAARGPAADRPLRTTAADRRHGLEYARHRARHGCARG